MKELDTDIVVIGAGVIGLACAAELSKKFQVVILEKHRSFGQETSSRNSEVIHSGLYYAVGSKKTEYCIEGNKLLYEYCEKNDVHYKRTGKYIVATSDTEKDYLQKRFEHCKNLDIACENISQTKLKEAAPYLKATHALFLPNTGVVNSHELMQSLEKKTLENGAMFAWGHRVTSIQKENNGWTVQCENPDGEFEISSKYVVNAGGLGAADLSNQALETKKYEHRFCRGRYMTLKSRWNNKFQNLIYPVPNADGLGVHVTIDLNGQARLGPDTDWLDGVAYSELDRHYDCDWEPVAQQFVSAARKYLPDLTVEDLSPLQIGVRPKLFINGEPLKDFLVENVDGFIHCLGIESPGLTSCLVIANQVRMTL